MVSGFFPAGIPAEQDMRSWIPTMKISVLYVDDEPTLLDIGKSFLELCGHFSVDTITSATEALRVIQRKKYDAILSDYQMPGMDGIEFLKQIRRSGNTVPFIIFTGRSREEIVIQALNEGADFYLQKGGDPEPQFIELSHKIRHAVQQRQAEASVRDHERRETDIINFLPDATFAIDTGGRVIAWNHAIEKLTGISTSKILGKDHYEYSIPFYYERRPMLADFVLNRDPAVAEMYSNIMKEGNNLCSEVTIPHFNNGDGGTFWFTASPLFDRQGNVIGAIELIHDITKRKKDEEALRLSESKYRTILDNIQDIYYRSDNDGNLVMISPSGIALLGYDSSDEILGKDTAKVIYADPGDRITLLSALGEQGSVRQYEVNLRRKDGAIVTVSTTSYYYYNPDGTVAGVEGIFRDITETKHAEESLQRERIFTDAVLNSVPGLLYLYDDDGYLRRWNKAHETLTGYTSQELSGKSILDWFRHSGTDTAIVREAVERGFREGYANIEANLQIKNGNIIPFYFTGTTLEIEGKRYFTGIGIDISDRKKAEKALVDSEAKYRSLAENTADVLFSVDKKGVITYVSPQISRYGYEPAHLLSKQFMTFIFPEDQDRIRNNFTCEMTTGQNIATTFRILDSSGKVHWMEERSNIQFDEYNQPGGLRGVLRDITERKQAENALRDFGVQVTNAMDLANLVNWEYDISSDTFTFNDRFYQMYGTSAEREGGYRMPRETYFREFVHPDDLPTVIFPTQSVENSIDLFRTIQKEHRIIRRDGEVRDIVVSLTGVEDDEGNIVRTIGANQDITERKRSEEALRQANHKLKLLASITRHDVANQIIIMKGLTQIALKKNHDPVVADLLVKIEQTESMITEQIEFTKIWQDIGNQTPDWFRIGDIVAYRIPKTIAFSCDCNVEVYADPMLKKVFFNLIDNSIRHGEHVTTIAIHCTREHKKCTIFVEDNGIGVPIDEKEKIFQRGYGKNSGLGLFLVREILAITGISIRETGEPGKGARFEIVVPEGGYRRQ